MENAINNPQTNGFKFTLTNGQVSSFAKVVGNHTINLPLPANATFTVSGTTITENITAKHETISRQFVPDSSNPALYHVGSETETVTNPTTIFHNDFTFGYGFTITNGKVTAEQITRGETGHTHTHSVAIPPTATFSVSGTQVIETVVRGNVVEQFKYVQSGTAGLYALASETENFVQAGNSATKLSVEPFERAKFTLDTMNHITQVQNVRADGSVITATPHTGTTYTQLATGYIVETTTRGNHSSYEVFHDGNNDGIYTAVAHGSGVTVDLVGLKAQISVLIDSVT